MPTAAADPDAPAKAARDRNILWKIVHDRCEAGYQRTGAYAPCALVDENAGTALYKVDFDPYQYLLLPLARVTGIEDPALQEPTSPNYLQDAWAARTLLTSGLNNRLREPDIVLAINSQNSRDQDQLHIHISCASRATAEALKTVDAAEYGGWKPLSTQLNGQTYQALAVTADTLKSKNLFHDVYAKVIGDDSKMEDASVALVNLAPDQFLLLLLERTEDRRIQAESLQDHNCSLANTE
ncbi:MAG: CDP-diacylglycerol diphosphatase [Mycobacterium sp.]|nr:CDP-diacylglycerol diphosphatase [Mycobacterium sp.]